MTPEQIREQGLIIFECIAGSRAYGLQTKGSDTDIRGVFILPEMDYFGLDYVEQVNNPSNDIVFYELKRFFDLLSKNNPNILELLNMPPDTVIYRHPLFERVESGAFLSKLCKLTFAGYAKAQIGKARGLNKKIMKPLAEERKTILDFCYVVEGQGAVKVEKWLSQRGWKQEFCGLTSIPHMHDVYGLFYDASEGVESPGYKGIMRKSQANSVCLSSVPREASPVGVMSFNKDGYTQYCKDYKEYWDWVGKRNEARYLNTISHGKNYDSKNMMHTMRLLDMAAEIATEGKIFVRRPNRDFLMRVRKGEFLYEELVEIAEKKMGETDRLFEASTLPSEPDREAINRLLVEIRKSFYIERALS